MPQAFPSLFNILKSTRRLACLTSARRFTTTASLSSTAPEPAIPAIRLRQYQEECIQSVLSHLEKGHKRLGVSLATGSGKTVIFTHLIDRVHPTRNGANQTLILAHRRELVEQAARHCINVYPSKLIEVEMGDIHASGTAEITIASIMSISSGDRLSKFRPERFKLVLVDEAHHIVAPKYMDTLRYFGLMEPTEHSPALVGVSATLSRFDGLKLGAAIDHVVYHKDYVDMIGEKWLSNVIFTTVQSKADISRVRKGSTGDFQVGDLSRAINNDETNEITVRSWLSRAENRKSTIVFCVDLAHVSGLTKTFREHGIDAQFITGDTSKQIRSARLEAFKNGDFRVLLNCGVFTEGTDIPNIDCVLLARPTKSRNLLVQMMGRGLRLHPGKQDCHVIDMVASLESGIVTTPTLFGLDPGEVVKEVDVELLKQLRERKEFETRHRESLAEVSPGQSILPNQLNKNITFTDYDSVFDLINDTSGERRIRGLSQLAWVNVGEDRYILSTKSGDYMTIEKDTGDANPNQFGVWLTKKTFETPDWAGKSPYMRPRQIASSSTLSDAVHAADTYASKAFVWFWISKQQTWRKAPASDGQLKFLNKLRGMNDQLTADSITKGKAIDMIVKVKYGAKGRFSKIEAAKRREARASEKTKQEESLRKREEVQVGPLAGSG